MDPATSLSFVGLTSRRGEQEARGHHASDTYAAMPLCTRAAQDDMRGSNESRLGKAAVKAGHAIDP